MKSLLFGASLLLLLGCGKNSDDQVEGTIDEHIIGRWKCVTIDSSPRYHSEISFNGDKYSVSGGKYSSRYIIKEKKIILLERNSRDIDVLSLSGSFLSSIFGKVDTMIIKSGTYAEKCTRL